MRVPSGALEFTQVTAWDDGSLQPHEDLLAAEEPLEIRIGHTPVTVTMRTPGHDLELAAGFLLTEGIIDSADQLVKIESVASASSAKRNIVQAQLLNTDFAPEEIQRNFFAASSCGICGKASIEAVRRRGLSAPNRNFHVPPEVLCRLPGTLRAQQQVFDRTGGLHAAALFDEQGNLLVLREDIGRHNAVDKLVGWALLEHRLPLGNMLMLVSGRGGFEIVQKALAAGVPFVASVSAPSSLAVKLAREMSLTLVGFLRGQRFVVYSGDFRCLNPFNEDRHSNSSHIG